MTKEEIEREIRWQKRSAKISRSWGDEAGARKCEREIDKLTKKLKQLKYETRQ